MWRRVADTRIASRAAVVRLILKIDEVRDAD
jgi:hypothetical protein